ncbi:MAG: hypothetical protein WD066_10425 [Planctomycetaceae bacterium]
MAHFIFLGGLLLVTAWLLHRGARRRGESVRRDLPAEVRAELRANERSDTGRLRQLEIRLHEYGREVEARMETRLAVLDRLLREADREIVRLTGLLERRQSEVAPPERSGQEALVAVRQVDRTAPDIIVMPASTPPRISAEDERGENAGDASRDEIIPLTAAQRVMLGHLADAGYCPAELATLLARPLPAIEAALREQRRAAA